MAASKVVRLVAYSVERWVVVKADRTVDLLAEKKAAQSAENSVGLRVVWTAGHLVGSKAER